MGKKKVKFRNIIINLVEGDEIIVFGGIRKPDQEERMTINLEEIQITNLVEYQTKKPPKCPNCQIALKSAGKNSGFKCKKCSFKTPKKEYIILKAPRKLRLGVRYVTPVCAQRHLTKPVQRDIALQFHLNDTKNHADSFNNFLGIMSSLLENANSDL